MRVIYINFIGRTANRVIEYMTARSLMLKSGKDVLLLLSHDIPEFNIKKTTHDFDNLKAGLNIHITSNTIPFNYLVDKIRENDDIFIELNSYCQRIEFFKEYLSIFKGEIINSRSDFDFGFGAAYVVFHVRLAHIHFNSSVHPWYIPLPFNYYQEIINNTGLKPVFVGEFSDDIYSNALKMHFSNAVFLECEDSNVVYQVLHNSKNVGISLSSFSWLATFLSDHVVKVFFPVFGLFDPRNYNKYSSQSNFLDFDDLRVQYYRFEIKTWQAKYIEILSLISDKYHFEHVDQEIIHDFNIYNNSIGPDINPELLINRIGYGQ